MAGESSVTHKAPLYKRSPWLPRGQVRRLIFLGLITLTAYGSTRHWFFYILLLISIIALSPKVLLATAYYYGRSALFLGQLFSK
ncbi:hypothetical protein POPA111323_00020 [Polynucleobacter paneuropaeus]|jgi:hypothetical protein|uniref:Uncharacterized protein n=1 Tax=Polynucleobacter paneuropaeus TaxID=2527775 RepID=A0A2Z4JR08_9BURK|nr:hypothetical protein Pas1_01755 [Polynucleobacter paneuropaeus]